MHCSPRKAIYFVVHAFVGAVRACLRLLKSPRLLAILTVLGVSAGISYKIYAPVTLIFGQADIYPDSAKLETLTKAVVADEDKEVQLLHRFGSFFSSDQLRGFMRDYRKNCQPPRLRLAVSLDEDWRHGLDSFLNGATSVYLIANEPAIRSRHYFQLVLQTHRYAAVSNVFTDLAKGTWCPFFENMQLLGKFSGNGSSIATFREDFFLLTSKGSPRISADSDVILPFHSSGFAEIRKGIDHIVDRDGMRAVFKQKSIVARAIWQPKVELKKLMLVLWLKLLGDTKKYVGVHIPRSASSGSDREASLAAVVRTASSFSATPSSLLNLFVVAEEEGDYEDLRTLLSGYPIATHDLTSLVRQLDLAVPAYIVPAYDSVIRRTPHADPSHLLVHTKQLVVQLSLLALADDLICSMALETCRFVALLRGSHDKNVHSIDGEWKAY